MPEIRASRRFKKLYGSLPVLIREKVKKTLRLLAENPRHPSLRTKPIQGAKGLYEARIDEHYRLTYERLPGDVLQIRALGVHDDLLKNP
jgi:mRNA-degrading endonuclease RelE of RelBE toxin-antitoxin system